MGAQLLLEEKSGETSASYIDMITDKGEELPGQYHNHNWVSSAFAHSGNKKLVHAVAGNR